MTRTATSAPPQPKQEVARLEALLRASQRTEALGRFSAAMAHDFCNLLIVAGEQVRQLRQAPGDTETLDELEALLASGLALCRQLLDFAHAGEGAPERLDLREPVGRACSWVARLLPKKVQLQVRLPEAPLPVDAIRHQLEQLLVNLLVNARDAMPNGGAITVTATDQGERLQLQVQDTGEGIAPAALPRIFRPLYTTKPKGEGTGLGLAVAKDIAARHNGALEVASAPGKGATFTLTLPKRQTSQSPAAAAPKAAAS